MKILLFGNVTVQKRESLLFKPIMRMDVKKEILVRPPAYQRKSQVYAMNSYIGKEHILERCPIKGFLVEP